MGCGNALFFKGFWDLGWGWIVDILWEIGLNF
jgi:hypothetical protein